MRLCFCLDVWMPSWPVFFCKKGPIRLAQQGLRSRGLLINMYREVYAFWGFLQWFLPGREGIFYGKKQPGMRCRMPGSPCRGSCCPRQVVGLWFFSGFLPCVAAPFRLPAGVCPQVSICHGSLRRLGDCRIRFGLCRYGGVRRAYLQNPEESLFWALRGSLSSGQSR